MSKIRNWFARERNRAYVYRVIVAGGVMAVAYGWVTSEDVAVVSGFIATLFVLPAGNTSTDA